MEPTLEIFGMQINVLGSFNPPVITPAWLSANKLLGEEDEKFAWESESLVITPEISRFETEWFSIQIIKQQLVLNSKGPVAPNLKDLIVGIFTLLGHTPISALGINSLAHYKIYSVAEFHKIGDVLAPKSIWNSMYPETENQSVGLTQISIQVSPFNRADVMKSNGKAKNISLSRSDKIPHSIYFTFNDHYPISIENYTLDTDSELLIDLVQRNFDSSQEEAKNLFANVLNTAINL